MPRPVSNPPNPWSSTHVDWLGEPPPAELELFEEEAKSILSENESPDVGMRWSLNPYRGCFHGCAYCVSGDTPILMADGTTRRIAELSVGDEIFGTVVTGAYRAGRYRRFVRTRVLAHWSTVKPAYRITLRDETELIASGDHRFMTWRGWKYVTGAEQGRHRRPHLTLNDRFVGVGAFAMPPPDTTDYRQGYLCGMVRGDALLRAYSYPRRGRTHDNQYQFRLALVDLDALRRARTYLSDIDIGTHEYVFQEAVGARKRMVAIRTNARAHFEQIRTLIEWPSEPSLNWTKGFLAGVFDAEGCGSGGVLRISNTDPTILDVTTKCLVRLGFDSVIEPGTDTRRASNVRIRGGLREALRFFHTTNPAITRKREIDGRAIKHDLPLEVASIEPIGVDLPMFDITTGTGDFIANGVVSHNCYARPSHQYLGFGAGTDFDRKIVVKMNAPELLRAEFEKRSWKGESIAFSGNTDCYQPVEASYGLTRRCLEVCLEYRNPVHMITKGMLIRRDADVLGALARHGAAEAAVSIPFADDATARLVEPYASPPSRRFETLRILSDAGVPTTVGIAPVIPGLSDSDIPEILERAHAAGARRAFLILLRLPREVLPVFQERITQDFPDRAQRIFHAVQEVRGGKMNVSAFGARMHGEGPRWQAIRALFDLHCRRLGMNQRDEEDRPSPFRRPTAQRDLFNRSD